MSTVVQPRREAASYVSTHAGAVGEMVIDQTNQRVTVHDGTTLGGFPAAGTRDLTGRNLLLNGNFSVNQRGYASGGALASAAYAHDRWRDLSNTANTKYTFTQGVPDTAVTITGGILGQIVDTSLNPGGTLALSWTGTCPMIAYATLAAGGNSSFSSASPIVLTGVAAGTPIYIQTNGTGTLGLVQLEVGNVATKFERRSNELALCQRYYWAHSTPNGNDYFTLVSSVNAVFNTVVFPVAMRATPTVTIAVTANGGTFASGMPSVNATTVTRAFLRADGGTAPCLTSLTASAEL